MWAGLVGLSASVVIQTSSPVIPTHSTIIYLLPLLLTSISVSLSLSLSLSLYPDKGKKCLLLVDHHLTLVRSYVHIYTLFDGKATKQGRLYMCMSHDSHMTKQHAISQPTSACLDIQDHKGKLMAIINVIDFIYSS